MREFGTFFICLGGGEPLTRPDLLDILEHGKNKQLASVCQCPMVYY